MGIQDKRKLFELKLQLLLKLPPHHFAETPSTLPSPSPLPPLKETKGLSPIQLVGLLSTSVSQATEWWSHALQEYIADIPSLSPSATLWTDRQVLKEVLPEIKMRRREKRDKYHLRLKKLRNEKRKDKKTFLGLLLETLLETWATPLMKDPMVLRDHSEELTTLFKQLLKVIEDNVAMLDQEDQSIAQLRHFVLQVITATKHIPTSSSSLSSSAIPTPPSEESPLASLAMSCLMALTSVTWDLPEVLKLIQSLAVSESSQKFPVRNFLLSWANKVRLASHSQQFRQSTLPLFHKDSFLASFFLASPPVAPQGECSLASHRDHLWIHMPGVGLCSVGMDDNHSVTLHSQWPMEEGYLVCLRDQLLFFPKDSQHRQGFVFRQFSLPSLEERDPVKDSSLAEILNRGKLLGVSTEGPFLLVFVWETSQTYPTIDGERSGIFCHRFEWNDCLKPVVVTHLANSKNLHFPSEGLSFLPNGETITVFVSADPKKTTSLTNDNASGRLWTFDGDSHGKALLSPSILGNSA